MSRRPGIGASWLEKYGREVKAHHNVVVKGHYMAPPRYYRDKVYEQSDRDIVRSSIINKIVAQVKEELEYERIHNQCYEDEVSKARDRSIRARLELKRRK